MATMYLFIRKWTQREAYEPVHLIKNDVVYMLANYKRYRKLVGFEVASANRI